MRPEPDALSELPSTRRALWRALVLAYRAEPRLLVVSFALVVGSWVPASLGALWLKLLAAGVLGSVVLGWLLKTVGGRMAMLLRERATVALEAHVARLHADIAGIGHLERAEHLDRLQLLRQQVFLLNHLYPALMDTAGSVLRLALTVGLLMS